MNQVLLNSKRCKGCGMCFDNCPKHDFDHAYLGAQPVVARIEDCVGCGMCELKCPDFAITVIRAPKSK